MKRYLSFVAFSLLLGLACHATNRALLVAIDTYQDKYWNDIHATNDTRVITDALKSHGFAQDYIATLNNEAATHDAIVKAIKDLTSDCKRNPGGIVYVHFSCHGQQMDDLNGQEADNLCESIIPYDARQKATSNYHGEKHLPDYELVPLLEALRAAIGPKGQLLLVVDACHSDGIEALRGISPSRRGSDTKFTRGDGTAKKSGYRRHRNRPARNTAKSKNMCPQLSLKAAQAAKQCSEMWDPAVKTKKRTSRDIYGKLSYHLCQAINNQAAGKFNVSEIESKLISMKIDGIHINKKTNH